MLKRSEEVSHDLYDEYKNTNLYLFIKFYLIFTFLLQIVNDKFNVKKILEDMEATNDPIKKPKVIACIEKGIYLFSY